jgi:hypothetical protein
MPGSALQGAFTSGELAPSLSARVDLDKYGKGCRTLKNFLVQAHGGAVKRPGFELLDALPGPCVLVPFVFNEEQAYCLCFGNNWLRVATYGGFVLGSGNAPYQIASPYSLEQARRLSHVQSADVLFIACHGVVPTRLKRQGHANWSFESMSFTAPLAAPGWVSAAFSNEAKMSDGSVSEAQLVTPYTYYVTAVDANGRERACLRGRTSPDPPPTTGRAGTTRP